MYWFLVRRDEMNRGDIVKFNYVIKKVSGIMINNGVEFLCAISRSDVKN